MAFPTQSRYVIIGAGIHGLSTAWHLARQLKADGRGDGGDVLVIDKTSIAAGASGIACGVVRNNYFQPAMRELMAHSVSRLGQRRRQAFSLSPGRLHADQPRESMHADVAYHLTISRRRSATTRCSSKAKTDCSELHESHVRRLAGARASPRCCMKSAAGTPTTPKPSTDWPAKAEAEGVRIMTGRAP